MRLEGQMRVMEHTMPFGCLTLRCYVFLLLCTVLLLFDLVECQTSSTTGAVMRGPCQLVAGQFDCTKQAINADITLGGLVPVHLFDENRAICDRSMVQSENLQWVEAMRDAVNQINMNPAILNNINLGYEIRDSCRRESIAVLECLEFIGQSTSNGQCTVAATSGSRIQPSVVGVVGSLSSSVSLRTTELLGLFNIPMVSYGSTSPRLSNKRDFPYFLRTIPSDGLAAIAIAKMVRSLNWDFIGLVHTSDVFGMGGAEQVRQALGIPDICQSGFRDNTIAKVCLSMAWEIRDGATAGDATLGRIWSEILSRSVVGNSNVIIMFTQERETQLFFESALMADEPLRSQALEKNVTFIGVDAWGDIITAVRTAPAIAMGSVSAIPLAAPYAEFERHWTGLNPATDSDDPWLAPLWQQQFRCTPNTLNPSNPCNDRSLVTNFTMSSKVPYVYHSVYAFAHALDRIYQLCRQDKACLIANASSQLLEELKNVNFRTIYGSLFRFEQDGDPAIAEYDIKNMVVSLDSRISFPNVGKYVGTAGNAVNGTICAQGTRRITTELPTGIATSCLTEAFEFNKSDVRWNSGTSDIPVSVCSATCTPGYKRQAAGITTCHMCCWNCVPCDPNFISTRNNSNMCVVCDVTQVNNTDNTECVDVPLEEFSVPAVLPIVMVCVASIGIVGVIAAFVKCVLRVSDSFFIYGREPTFFCLFGLLCVYISILVAAAGPSAGVCLARLVLASAGATALISSILVFVVHRLTVAGGSIIARLLIHPPNRLVVSLLLEVITAALLLLLCVDGKCLGFVLTARPPHKVVHKLCGFGAADTGIVIFLCIMSLLTFALCIATVAVIKKKKLASVIYDPNSRLFSLILVATGMATAVAIACALIAQDTTLSVYIQDGLLHITYWQFATAYFVMALAQPIRKLGQLSKSEEVDYTATLEKETQTSYSISGEMTSWAKSLAARARGSSAGKLDQLGVSPPEGTEEDAGVKSISSGSYKEAQGTSVLRTLDSSPYCSPRKVPRPESCITPLPSTPDTSSAGREQNGKVRPHGQDNGQPIMETEM